MSFPSLLVSLFQDFLILLEGFERQWYLILDLLGALKTLEKAEFLLKVVENSLKFCSDGIERITVIERLYLAQIGKSPAQI